MTVWRHLASGELSQSAASPRPATDWEALPDPPAITGWAWDNAARAWVARGPRLWPQVEFARRLFLPAEIVAADLLPADTPERQLFRWANSVASRVAMVNLDDPNTAAFVALAVAVGVLTPARAARVLAGLEPE